MIVRRSPKRTRARRPRPWWVWGLGLAGVAYLGAVLANGLDRETRYRLDVAALVPPAFMAQTLGGFGGQALGKRDGAGTLDYGRRAIDATPMEPSSPALFGAGQALLGRGDDAEASFTIAAKMGWRVPITQIYWMQRALSVGDNDVAMLRLDALLRQMAEFHYHHEILDAFETNPAAAQVLLARLAQQPVWMQAYVADVGHLDDGQVLQRSALLNVLAVGGHPLGCDLTLALTDRLVHIGHYEEASTFWRTQCHDGSDGPINDGDLAHAGAGAETTSPFRWAMLSTGDVSVTLTEGKGNHIVTVSNTSELPMPFLRQLLVAGPGHYQLSWVSAAPAGAGDAVVTPRFNCGDNTAAPVQLRRGGGPNTWVADVDLATRCTAPWLSFYVKGGAQGVQFGKVAMKRP